MVISGPGGSRWALRRAWDSWHLRPGRLRNPAVTVMTDPDTMWRLLTKGISPSQAKKRAIVQGDHTLGERFFSAVAILA